MSKFWKEKSEISQNSEKKRILKEKKIFRGKKLKFWH